MKQSSKFVGYVRMAPHHKTLLLHKIIESCWWFNVSDRSSHCRFKTIYWQCIIHCAHWFADRNGRLQLWRKVFWLYCQLRVELINLVRLGWVLLFPGSTVIQPCFWWRLSCCLQRNTCLILLQGVMACTFFSFRCDMICIGMAPSCWHDHAFLPNYSILFTR